MTLLPTSLVLLGHLERIKETFVCFAHLDRDYTVALTYARGGRSFHAHLHSNASDYAGLCEYLASEECSRICKHYATLAGAGFEPLDDGF